MSIKVSYGDSTRVFVFNNAGKNDFPYFTIGINSYINQMDIQLNSGNENINIHIGNYCSIAYNVTLLVDRNHDYQSVSTSPLLEIKRKLPKKGQIIIGHDVWIGNSVTILSGVRIGNGAVIGAGTVVTKDVPAYAVVAGNPMRIVKYRFDIAQINKLQKIKWWNWNREEIEKNKGWFAKKIEKFTHHFEKSYDEIIESITMKKKSKSILFIADFDEKYSIWEKVLTEYISHFSSEDDVTLLLRIETSERFDFNINAVQNIISKKINLPDILIINDVLYEEKSLFEKVDYFITSRVPKTIQYVDFADEFNVKILSGVDSPIFVNL